MGIPPISFTGLSSFSDDFAVILQRTFDVANLPIQQLLGEQVILLARQQQLSTLRSTIQGLEDRFTTLGLLGANAAVTASSSDSAIVSVLTTGSPATASYDFVVTSAASVAQEVSLTGLPDSDTSALSADGIYDLTLGVTTTNIDLLTIGSGRTAGTTGAATPSPLVSVQVDFSNGLSGSITADLESFFVGSQAPSGISAGDTISVSFISTDLTINEGITTVALAGTETTADIAQLLNDQITANGNLNGKVSFSDEGGKLKLVVSDTAGQGFTFTSSNTGTVVSGLEAGGTVGGHSAAEIAAALNAQVALDPTLVAAAVTFTAVGGEVKVLGNTAFDITGTDSAQGTGFVSGLAGTQSVAGYDNTLTGLRDFINDASLGLTASLINTSSDPDILEYHLSLTAQSTGVTTLTLKDSGAADLLTLSDQGTDAIFTVNGLAVTNSENTITDFEPGLSVTITGDGSATVNVATDRTALSSAISGIVANYNSVVGALQAQIGENAGVLSGSLIVRQTQQTLREITSFTGSGNLLSIVELGLELDDKGLMSFNDTTFNALSDSQLGDVLTFVGDTTSGFAGGAFSRLNDLADPVTGQIETAIGFLTESDASITVRIDAARERVDKVIATLEQQFAAADLLLAQLESQENLLTQVFRALEDVRSTFR